MNANKILYIPHYILVRCIMTVVFVTLTGSYCLGQQWNANRNIRPRHHVKNIINCDSAYLIYDRIKYEIDTLNTIEDSGVFKVFYMSKDYESERYYVIGVESLQEPYKTYLILTDKEDRCPSGVDMSINSCYYLHIRRLYAVKEPLEASVEHQETCEGEIVLIDDRNDGYYIVRGGRKDYIRCLSLHKSISISDDICGARYIGSH